MAVRASRLGEASCGGVGSELHRHVRDPRRYYVMHSSMAGGRGQLGWVRSGVGGIEKVVTAYRSPWQNAYAERVIGSIRRECLDHMIILNEDHLKHVLDEYVEHYNVVRPHQSLDRNSPEPREIESPGNGPVVSKPYLGGLHHRYSRAA